MNRTCGFIVFLCVVACSRFASAEIKLTELEAATQSIDWNELKQREFLKSGVVLPAEGEQAARLLLEKTTDGPENIPLFEIEPVPINGKAYAIKGRIRYAGVDAGQGGINAGYLEMWSHFPDGSAYFTRTLAEFGPMAKFSGTSDWREILLPFEKGTHPSPTKLAVNLVLPGPGTVELTRLELFQAVDLMLSLKSDLQPPPARNAWWDDRTGGLIGGLAGSLIGLLGGVIGVAVGVFRQRTLGNVLSAAILLVGLACLIAGLIALMQAQPYAVYYPLLLLGGICTLCAGIGLVVIRVGFQQDEFRRMQALDVR